MNASDNLNYFPIPLMGVHCSLWSETDIYLFGEGRHYSLHRHFGAHEVIFNQVAGVYFSLWAPSAAFVSVIGDFNHWDKEKHPMDVRWDSSGIWEVFIPGVEAGALYKFHIKHPSGYEVDKADPFSKEMELPPGTASRISRSLYSWTDKEWLDADRQRPVWQRPMSIYELHFGSWKRVPEERNRWLSYREMAEQLPGYLNDMGFTHVEFMPLTEHPFFGSWGYQVTGYFAASSRFGTPDDLRFLIDELHKNNLGVILDWVPAHFPGDMHGLHFFDGSHLYEHADPRAGFHPDWKSYIFNYGRNEVRSFLISSACFWLQQFHADGLRVDGVASMLYRDYSREADAWIPNIWGGRENLEAISFLKAMNEAVHTYCPGTFTVAEESTSFPGVTQTVGGGGLGFDFKWMMGWMHDTLTYLETDPIFRTHHQHKLSFGMHYFYSEKFILPLSHDEVVYGKGALREKLPGDDWQKNANLRLLYGYMFGHPGAKLLFMGGEFGQTREWAHERSLDWHLLDITAHKQIKTLISDLNKLYTTTPALHLYDYDAAGFEWIDFNDKENSVLCWMRKGGPDSNPFIFVLNATPAVLYNYRIGINVDRNFHECLNTDDRRYGGSGVCNADPIAVTDQPAHGKRHSLSITLPPLAVLILKPQN